MEEEKQVIPDELRPTCSCGKKMLLKEFEGYYDEFRYFECPDQCYVFEDKYLVEDILPGAYT